MTGVLGERAKAAAGWVALLVALVLAGEFLLPKGLNAGAIALGVVFGCLDALVAMGLVLVFRSSRVINFAQASFGGLAAAVMLIMVVTWHVPFLAAVPVALLVALGSGAATDRFVVRRLSRSPKLLLTVATIGVGQVVAALQLGLPALLAKKLTAFSTYTTPLHGLHFSIATTYFTGDSVLAVGVVVVVLVALAWFLGRTDLGLAIRAAADSNERALLLGIPVATLSLASWTLAAGLSGVGTILAVPIEGQNLGSVIGPEGMLVPLAAAMIARFESLPMAFGSDLLGQLQRHHCLEWEIRAGVLPVAEIIRSATLVGAKLCGLEGQVGAIIPGAYADLLVVDGDPYRHVSVLQGDGAHMAAIMKGGAFYKNAL